MKMKRSLFKGITSKNKQNKDVYNGRQCDLVSCGGLCALCRGASSLAINTCICTDLQSATQIHALLKSPGEYWGLKALRILLLLLNICKISQSTWWHYDVTVTLFEHLLIAFIKIIFFSLIYFHDIYWVWTYSHRNQ